MTVATRTPKSIKLVLDRLHRDYFPGARFSEPHAGIAVAHDHRRKLTSAFQPLIRASDGGIAGYHALLRAADESGCAVAPADLFEGAHGEDGVEHLDRLARALHAVNYFASANDGSRLFVTISTQLIGTVEEDHRHYFDALLTALDVPTSRVVVSLPDAVLDDPVTFVRSVISYGIRGYRVLANLRHADAHADLQHVFMADPHYVAIDAAGLAPAAGAAAIHPLRGALEALHGRGIQTVACRIETEEQALAARDAGFTLLLGRHFAPPALMRPAIG